MKTRKKRQQLVKKIAGASKLSKKLQKRCQSGLKFFKKYFECKKSDFCQILDIFEKNGGFWRSEMLDPFSYFSIDPTPLLLKLR